MLNRTARYGKSLVGFSGILTILSCSSRAPLKGHEMVAAACGGPFERVPASSTQHRRIE